MSDQVRAALTTIVEGGSLTMDQARLAMGAVMDGQATASQLAAMLMGLRMRGETVEELAGFASAMRERVLRVDAPAGTIDIVGTGGDGSNTFNISTTAALVVAACGVPVAKHGNRAITSRSGSADVLDALGIRIEHDAASAARSLREHGFAFLFANLFHPAMRHAGPTRREIGVRTAFNLLGPLTNPAGATRALIGVGDEAAAPKIAEVLLRLGTDRTLVVAGKGVDELPLDGTGVIWDVTSAGIERREVTPEIGGPAAGEDRRAGRRRPGREREARRGRAPGRARRAARRGAAQRGGSAGRRGRGRDDRGGHRPRRPDRGRGHGDGPADRAARRPAQGRDRGARRGRGGRREPRMTAARSADRPPRAPSVAAPAPRAGVVTRIAARRREDVRRELDGIGRDGLRRAVAAAPAPRPIAASLADPGLHLLAEVKRRSPSAGDIAAGDDAVARARAYAAGGAAAISVLCEPHWFGGSLGDLRAVRAAVSVPVLAKEFVVDPRQLDLVRAAGADVVLLLAVLHPAARLARLVGQARDLGLEPLVEAHDARELDAALATGARLIGINNRDLGTLEVDPERAVRLRDLIPADRLAVAESGVRDTATVARWRASGFDAALVGEALMRSPDPAAAARAFVSAGAYPADLAAAARQPMVKICGITDEAGILAAVRAGADAVGLNFAPGTPRALSIEEGIRLAALARSAAGGAAVPRIVVVTADLPAEELARVVAAVNPDAVQLNGSEPASSLAGIGRPAWKALRLGAGDHADDVVARARGFLAEGAERILLDAAGGPHPGGTGMRVDAALAARVAREVPVTLAGGLGPVNVGEAVLAVPATGVDVASGVEAPRVPGERPHKDPVLVALFAKRARDARRHRPNVAFGPTPVHAGLIEVDAFGRWGKERDFGGRYVPETLVGALEQLQDAYEAIRHDPRFWAELDDLLGRFAGRPTALYRSDRLAAAVAAEAHRLQAAAGERGRRGPRSAGTGPDPGAVPALPQARGPRPHRGPQDQQRARPGAADPASREDARDRRDGRRPARRRHGDGLRAARVAVRRVHGRGGHPPPGRPTCSACARSAPRCEASRPGRPRSRTPSTRRCATG